jgi:hypothetical protein
MARQFDQRLGRRDARSIDHHEPSRRTLGTGAKHDEIDAGLERASSR